MSSWRRKQVQFSKRDGVKKRRTTEDLQNTSQASSGSDFRDDTILCQLFLDDTALQRLGEKC